MLGISQTKLSGDSLELIIEQAIEYQNKEEYTEAANLLSEGIDKIDEKTIPDSILAYAYHKLGVSQYYLSFNDDAIQSWKTALEIRSNFLSNTAKDIIKGHRNIGNAYVDKGQFELAQQSMEKALKLNLNRITPDSNLLTEIYRELGFILTKQNDFANSEIYLNEAAELSPIIFEQEPWEIAHTYNLLLLLHLQQNQPEEMIKFARKGLEIYEALTEKYEEDYGEMAHFYNNLGLAYEKLRNYNVAIDNYKKALKICENYTLDSEITQARVLNNLAVLNMEVGNYESAFFDVNQAINLNEKIQNTVNLAGNFNTKGGIFLRVKDYNSALFFYQKGIECLIPGFNFNQIDKLPEVRNSILGNKPLLIQHLFDKALTHQILANKEKKEANLLLSLQTIDSINILINQVRTGFESDASKEFLSNKAKSIFETAIEICFELAQLTEEKEKYFQKAFTYAEQSKSIILLEAVKETGAKKLAGIPEKLLLREKRLKEQIAEIEEALFSDAKAEENSSSRTDLLGFHQQLAALVDTFEQFYPTYHELKYSFEPTDFQTHQQQLTAEECILEYFIGEKSSYWFYLDKEGIKMDTIANSAILNNSVIEFRNSITAPYTQNTFDKDNSDIVYTELGHQLYRQLAAPALSSKTMKKIRVIPDGILGYLPFDALLTEPIQSGKIGQYNIYPFLQRTQQISYSYSIALLDEMRQNTPHPQNRELLAFATTFEATQGLNLGQTTIKLSPLLANIPTAEDLLENYAGKGYLKAAATKTAFLKDAPSYAFLHLASHAQMNDENADYSFISFSQNAEQIQQEELLFVNELYNIPLQAEMVVLSACETALGEVKEGEGIISLARAFAYAGAQSIITTLWQVSDQRSSELITAFYENLANGLPKDEALWAAKNIQIESGFNAHPYNWAGYIPIGNMQAVQLAPKRNLPFLKIGIFLLFILGVVQLLLWKKSKA